MRKRVIWSLSSVVALGVAAVTGVAIATPPSGIVEAPIVARGSFTDRVDTTFTFKLDGKRKTVDVKNAEQTVVQQIVLAPGGHTGWHSHPGPVVVVVQAGELTVTQGNNRTCTGVTYTAGQAFMDPGQGNVHIANNQGEGNVELWATYFDVTPGGSPRLDANDPGRCPDLSTGTTHAH